MDILVNNAGATILKAPQDYTEDEWHHVMDTNEVSIWTRVPPPYDATANRSAAANPLP